MELWISFIICSFLIVFSGIKLSRYGDIIAEKTGLGGTWIGIVLMASVTSLPELVTGISSVTYSDAPNIAIGNVIGACGFNLLIFVFLDAIYKTEPLSGRAQRGHIISGGFGIIMLAIVASGIFIGDKISSFKWIGFYSFIIIFVYFLAMRIIYAYEKKQIKEYLECCIEKKYMHISLKKASVIYTVNAVVVISAAMFLPELGKKIAELTGFSQTFVGSSFIALTTSLPEIVVSISAVKIGSIDLAIGNIFGSVIFNNFILAVDDILYFKGPLLSNVNYNVIISAISVIIMLSIAVIGLTFRAKNKRLIVAWDSIFIAAVFLMNLYMLFTLK